LNGAEPFQWHWEDGTTFPALTGLSSGEYRGTLTDAFGCAINWVLPLEDTDSIYTQIQTTSATGEQNSDGAITLSLSGGTGVFDVSWSNGNTGLSLINLLPGTYSATITDERGCAKVVTATVQ
jgi:hypothetical protein